MTRNLLAPALDYASGSAARITLADLGRPSACAGWTVADVLVHLTQSLRFLATSLVSGAVPEPVGATTGPVTVGTLRRELDDAAACLTDAARDPLGRRSVDVDGLPLRCRQLVVVGAIEATAHGWDAARGAGCARPVPGDLAAGLLAELPLVLDDDTRRGVFADPVALPGDRPVAERLLAALGRDPRAP
ncbi:TIGR03086 family metal-binding protein [Actinophytocola sp. NPDC049390]|uniref:TIGR03086 family metal-binding protein n=1 Tax=Actinophytocola sp. NPDC049390 TaxID=3363894 RepID=UPI0037886A6D